MTEKNIRHEFNKVEEEIEQAIQAEIRRLRSMGFSKAYICERSFEIEDGASPPDAPRIGRNFCDHHQLS